MVNLNQKNSKKQGDVGLGIAIGWFAQKGWTVCVPLTDSQGYDLVVEGDNGLLRVQVKTSRYKKKGGNYSVELRTKGGNRTGKGKEKRIGADVDMMFAVSPLGSYLIPVSEIATKSSISLCKKMERFRV